MEWSQVWRTVFVGWDGDVDLMALADELRQGANLRHGGQRSLPASSASIDRDGASTWVCRQIQSAY